VPNPAGFRVPKHRLGACQSALPIKLRFQAPTSCTRNPPSTLSGRLEDDR
jgi:hypothetical protein